MLNLKNRLEDVLFDVSCEELTFAKSHYIFT